MNRLPILLIALLLLSTAVAAIPEPATEFYGNISLSGGKVVVSGSQIRALDSDGVICGRFVVVTRGYYGLLSCNGDDLDTIEDEGSLDGEEIRFEIADSNVSVRPYGDYTWSSGKISRVDLRENHAPVLGPIIFPKLSVGVALNKTITATDEDNDTLFFYDNTTLFDIGLSTGKISFTPLLSQVGNHSVNFSVSDGLLTSSRAVLIEITKGYCGDSACNNGETCITCERDCGKCTTPPSGGGAGTGGGGANSQGTGSSESSAGGDGAADSGDTRREECVESWVCTEWSECSASGLQTRDCIDRARCGTEKNKPPTEQECIYAGTCNDKLKNCHDGDCEEGIDCGGPCPACTIFNEESGYPSLPNIESPASICGDNICGPGENCDCPQDCRSISRFPWWIFFLIIIIASILLLLSKTLLLYLAHKHSEMEKTYNSYGRGINATYIVFVVVVMMLMINSYITWFCLKRLIVSMALSTLAILGLIGLIWIYYSYSTRYEERRKLEHVKGLMQEHQARLSEIVEVEGKLITKVIDQFLRRVYQLYKDNDLLLSDFKVITRIYNMLKKFEASGLKETTLEKGLILLIQELSDDSAFKDRLDTDEKKRLLEELDLIKGYLARKSEIIAKIAAFQSKLQEQEKEPPSSQQDIHF